MINEKLFKSVETGNPAEVKKALTEERINAATYYGAKTIALAAKQQNPEILKMVLESGAKINRESFWRRTAHSVLSDAVREQNTQTLKLLLQYGAATDKSILNTPLLAQAISTGNKEVETILTQHGFRLNKNKLTLANAPRTKYVYEDDMLIPEKASKDNLFVQFAKKGNSAKINQWLVENPISEKALLAALDAALEKNNWLIAHRITEYAYQRDSEIYTHCIKKMFLKAAHAGDTENVKCYLEKLIENAVGVLTDDNGNTTLEIALQNNPADIIQILANYGFHENALQNAYHSLLNIKK